MGSLHNSRTVEAHLGESAGTSSRVNLGPKGISSSPVKYLLHSPKTVLHRWARGKECYSGVRVESVRRRTYSGVRLNKASSLYILAKPSREGYETSRTAVHEREELILIYFACFFATIQSDVSLMPYPVSMNGLRRYRSKRLLPLKGP